MELRIEPKFGVVSAVPKQWPCFLWVVSALALPSSLETQASPFHQRVVCRQGTSYSACVPSEGPRLPICGVCV